MTALLLFCWSELTWGVGGGPGLGPNQDWLGWAGWHLVLWCAAADSMGGMRWDFGVEGKGRVARADPSLTCDLSFTHCPGLVQQAVLKQRV